MAELKIISMDEVQSKEVNWLWYPYIPYGKITIIQGDPGEGKTTLALRLAALLSKGEALPYDDTEREPVKIIYQTAEDGLEDTIKDNPQVRVMVQDKSSLAPEGEAIAFELDKENGFSWLGHYDISVDDLLSGIPREKKSEQAENLILEYLSKGKYPQQALLKKAQAVGISKRVLDEAKKALNVQSVKEGSQWYWRLPEKME